MYTLVVFTVMVFMDGVHLFTVHGIVCPNHDYFVSDSVYVVLFTVMTCTLMEFVL